jgi:hypothetical protein
MTLRRGAYTEGQKGGMRMVRLRTSLMILGVLPALVGAVGCLPGFIPPVPVQPWVTERMEDKYAHPNDRRTAIMPPIRDGFPAPLCQDAPSEQEVLRTMPRVSRGVPFVREEFRDDIEIVCEKLVDKIDPPRFFPLVGPAQLHHCHWKCTIYYTETIQSAQPFPVRIKKHRVEVVYIDKDHLHQYVGCDPEAQKLAAKEHSQY